MERWRIQPGQAVAVGASIALHAIATWGLVSHEPAPALAPEQAMAISLVEAPPNLKPRSAAAVLPGPSHSKRTLASHPGGAAIGEAHASTAPVGTAPAAASSMRPSPQAAAEQPMVPVPMTFAGPVQDPLLDYQRRVWAHLAAHAPSAPSGAGVARVAFRLDESGKVLSLRLVRSSGLPTFDRACLASVRDAGPFPQPPSGVHREDLAFEVPLVAGERPERR